MKSVPWICGMTLVIGLIVTCVGEHQRATARAQTGNDYDCSKCPRPTLEEPDMDADQLLTAEAREADAQAALAEAQAEIERLKVENNKFRELTTTLREIIVR